MSKLISIIILVLCITPLIAAENGIEIIIKNNTISVRGYTMDAIYGKVDFGFFNKINDSLTSSIHCNNFTINVNGTDQTYQDNCTLNIDFKKDIPIFTQNESSTSIIGDTGLYNKLIECETLKAQYRAGLDSCVEDKATIKDVNTNYTQCSSDVQICRNDKVNLESKVAELNEDIDSHKNTQWGFLIFGLVAGGVIIMVYYGKIGGSKIKREDETFNPRQAA